MYNGHGDVTAIIDNDGKVAASYYYDAFGNILESKVDVYKLFESIDEILDKSIEFLRVLP